jgi:hypothetical protein
MKVKITKKCRSVSGEHMPGVEIEHAEAHRLIKLGVAEPADKEAEVWCKLYQAKQAAADKRATAREKQAAAARLAAFEKQLLQGLK